MEKGENMEFVDADEVVDIDYVDGVIDLDKYENYATKIKRGCCGNKYVFDFNGQKYYFKGNFEHNASKDDWDIEIPVEIRQDIIESFTSSLLRSVGVRDAVNYRLATFGGEMGCVSKDFKTEKTLKEFSLYDIIMFNAYNTKQVSPLSLDYKFTERIEDFFERNEDKQKIFFLFNVEDIMKELETFTKTYNMSFDKNKMKNFLTELCVVDYFICNDDRHGDNISFLLQKSGPSKLELINAPIYDNGYALGTWYIDNALSNGDDKKSVEALLGLTDASPEELGKYAELIYRNTMKNNTLKNNGSLALDIVQLTKRDKHIKTIVDNFVNLNIDKKLDEFEWFNDIEIPERYKQMMSDMYKSRINHYTKRARKLQKLLDKEL